MDDSILRLQLIVLVRYWLAQHNEYLEQMSKTDTSDSAVLDKGDILIQHIGEVLEILESSEVQPDEDQVAEEKPPGATFNE